MNPYQAGSSKGNEALYNLNLRRALFKFVKTKNRQNKDINTAVKTVGWGAHRAYCCSNNNPYKHELLSVKGCIPIPIPIRTLRRERKTPKGDPTAKNVST